MPGEAYHITQRGTNRHRAFFTDSDRSTYLKLMLQNLEDAWVRVLAWCLMKNHVHVVAVPERDSLGMACTTPLQPRT
jgi:putative transposase